MGTLGNQPNFGAYGFTRTQAESFNGTGSATSFTLGHHVKNAIDIEVLVDNVQQSPFDGSYSVSGTTLTFSGAPASGTNNVYVMYRQVGTVIDTQALVPDDGSVTDAKIVGMSSSKLTGALPAISGASLTGLAAGSCVFRAIGTNGSWASYAGGVKIILGAEWEDPDNVYDTTTGAFTAPANGVYHFYANIYTGQNDASNGFKFNKNGSTTGMNDFHNQFSSYMSQSDASDCIISMSQTYTLSSGDTVEIYTGTQSDVYQGHTSFGGHRLR